MKRYLLEAVGTFVLVLMVTGALVLYERAGSAPASLTIALVYGLVIVGLTLVLSKPTGAHLNPAVTLAYSVEGCLPWKQTLPYILSQCVGALAASELIKYIFPLSSNLGSVLQEKDDVRAFIQEYSYTLVLLTGIISIPKDTRTHRRLAAAVTGVLIALIVYLSGPLSGSGLNPARSLAPALLSHNTEGLWIYLVAPFCAALSAASIHAICLLLQPK